MNKQPELRNILFICGGNFVRSIIAEGIMNQNCSKEGFKAYSAGVMPIGAVHPFAIDVLEENGCNTKELISKGFSAYKATSIDFYAVITLCECAKNTAIPDWIRYKMAFHWDTPDPIIASDSEQEILDEFRRMYSMLERKIFAFSYIPFNELDQSFIDKVCEEVGKLGMF